MSSLSCHLFRDVEPLLVADGGRDVAGVDVAELVVLVVRDLDAVLVVRLDVLEPGIYLFFF